MYCQWKSYLLLQSHNLLKLNKQISFSVSVSVSFFLFSCSKGQVVRAYLYTIKMTLVKLSAWISITEGSMNGNLLGFSADLVKLFWIFLNLSVVVALEHSKMSKSSDGGIVNSKTDKTKAWVTLDKNFQLNSSSGRLTGVESLCNQFSSYF